MRRRTEEKPEEGHPGDRRRPEEEAVSLVRHWSMLSKTQPGDGGIGHRGGHWCS